MPEATTPHELTRRQLYKLVWTKPLTVVAEELGLSANGLAKICDRVNIPYPSRGYWARERAGRAPARSELPKDSGSETRKVSISGERSPSRRTRSRLTPEERKEQLIQSAKLVINRLGLHRTNMKRVAAEAGISEAQAHNYFSRDELLIELARRELSEMEEARQSDMGQAADVKARGMLGTARYLREVERRGALIQVLVTSPAVREALRKERRAKSAEGLARLSSGFAREFGVDPETARNTGRLMTAVSLRAGRMLASKKTKLATVEPLLLAIIASVNQQMIDDAQAGAGKKPVSSAASARRSPR